LTEDTTSFTLNSSKIYQGILHSKLVLLLCLWLLSKGLKLKQRKA